MKQYRLKPEAVKFFKDKHATNIYSKDVWDSLNVDDVALEEVEEAYLTFGHKDKDNKGSSLSGWGGEGKGGHYHFTIIFPSEKFKEHDQFSKGKMVRELMNKIQNQVNYFYQEFASKQS